MNTNLLKTTRSAVICSTLLLSITLSSCATSPEGRNQFKMIPQSEMNSLGVKSFEEIKKDTPITKDKNIQQYVNCIANTIIPQVEENPDPKQWEVQVFEDEQANAFALPGYKIGVYTGLLKYANNQDQLAAVIGHELAHVIAGHGNERVSSKIATTAGLTAAAILIGTGNNTEDALILAGLGLGVQYGIALPYSRSHETEADLIGLELMAESGFDPAESVTLWQNMSQTGAQPPEFMSTHPSNNTRIKQLKERIPKADIAYQQAVKNGQRAQCKL